MASVEERRRLPSPDALANLVEDVDQRVHVGGAETAAEIAGRGRIGNAAGAEGVEIDFILATQFEVLQTGAVAQGVVGQVEDMIGLVVGQMDFEQVQVVVDGVDEADASGQQVDGADAAVGQAAGAVGDLVMDVGGGEAWAGRKLPSCFLSSRRSIRLLRLASCGVSWRSLEIPFCWC